LFGISFASYSARRLSLAIVLLAIAGLVTMAHAMQPNNFGLPPDIAAKVKSRVREGVSVL